MDTLIEYMDAAPYVSPMKLIDEKLCQAADSVGLPDD
jgi:hypothetical protein